MRNATNRHVKTNVKNTKKQKTRGMLDWHGPMTARVKVISKTNVKNQVKQRKYVKLRPGDCCFHCKNKSGLGYFADTVRCYHVQSQQPPRTSICDKFERRE